MTINIVAVNAASLLHICRLVLPVIYMGLIYLLSSIPGTGETIPNQYRLFLWILPSVQNLLHVPLYGLLAWLWCWVLSARGKRQDYVILTAFLVTSIYGLLDEWHQLSVSGRYFSINDIALNVLGALLGVSAHRRLTMIRQE